MAKASDNPYPSLLVVEGTTPATPASGRQRLFVDSADGLFKRVDDAGVVTEIEGGGGLPVGGTIGQVLTKQSSTDGDADWETPASGGGWTAKINDDLSNISTLTVRDGAGWSNAGGVLNQSSTAAAHCRITHNTKGLYSAAEVECDYSSGAGSIRRMGLIFPSSNAGSGNILVHAESANGTDWTARVEVDNTALYYTSAALSYAGSGYLRIGAMVLGNAVAVFIDGVLIGTTTVGAYTGGSQVGLYTYGAAVDFRNLKTWSLFDPPPFA